MLNPVDRPLTVRQQQSLWLASKGHSNKEIARKLGISIESVKTHLAGAYRRLGIEVGTTHSTRSLAVRICFERGILPIPVPEREAS